MTIFGIKSAQSHFRGASKNLKVQSSGKATVSLSFMVYPHWRSLGIYSSDGCIMVESKPKGMYEYTFYGVSIIHWFIHLYFNIKTITTTNYNKLILRTSTKKGQKGLRWWCPKTKIIYICLKYTKIHKNVHKNTHKTCLEMNHL